MAQEADETMDGRAEERLHRPIQGVGDHDAVRSDRQVGDPAPLSADPHNNDMGCRLPAVDVLRPAPKIAQSGRPKNKSRGKAAASRSRRRGNGAHTQTSSLHVKCDAPDVEGEDFEVHVRCIRPVQSSEFWDSEIEGGPVDDSVGCQNHRSVLDMQTSLGELCRVGALGGDGRPSFKTPEKTAPCRFVSPSRRPILPLHPPLQASAATTVDARNNGMLSLPGGSFFSGEHSYFQPLIVDAIANDYDRRRIANILGNEVYTSHPSLLDHAEAVRSFGFEHIIFIAGINFGILFLDCFGRFFAWDEMTARLLPLGNTLEEAHALGNDSEIEWIHEDGEIVEYNPNRITARKTKLRS